MSKQISGAGAPVATATKKSKRVLPIIIAAILALVIVFGAVMGIILLVSEANAAVSYNGTRISQGAAAYLVSTYKATYNGKAEDLEKSAENYIRSVAAAAYLFDRNTSLSEDDRAWIDTNIAEILDYRADNSIERFNELSAPLGFDYDGFTEGVEVLYKASSAISVIYGVNGSNLAYSQNASLVYDYFTGYYFVKILFIRTETRFAKDADGNRIPASDGNDLTVSLDDAEKAERATDIARINELIAGANSGTGVEMTVEEFDSYYQKYNDDPDNADGYYFRAGTAFTEEFREEYPNLVESVLNAKIGEYATATDGETVCFIYRAEPKITDYVSDDKSVFFTDFYSGAAENLFAKSIKELAVDVKVKDLYTKIDVASIEKNNLFRTQLGIGINVG